MENYHPAIASYLGRVTVPPNYAGVGGGTSFTVPGYTGTGGELGAETGREPGIFGGLNVSGFELQGRLSAGFIGVIVIALVGFHLATKGFQL